jgi:hypothetical protein
MHGIQQHLILKRLSGIEHFQVCADIPTQPDCGPHEQSVTVETMCRTPMCSGFVILLLISPKVFCQLMSSQHDIAVATFDSDQIEWEFVTTDEINNLTIREQLEEIGENFLENLNERGRNVSPGDQYHPTSSGDDESDFRVPVGEERDQSTEISPLTQENVFLNLIEDISLPSNVSDEFQTRLRELEAIGDHLLQESLQTNHLDEVKSSHEAPGAVDLNDFDQTPSPSHAHVPEFSDISTMATTMEQQSPANSPPLTTTESSTVIEEELQYALLPQPSDIPLPSLSNDLPLPSLPPLTSTQQPPPPSNNENNQSPQSTSELSPHSSRGATNNLSLPPSSPSISQFSALENVLITLGGAVTIALFAWLYQLYVVTSKLKDS